LALSKLHSCFEVFTLSVVSLILGDENRKPPSFLTGQNITSAGFSVKKMDGGQQKLLE
jgi:hypothetical protein